MAGKRERYDGDCKPNSNQRLPSGNWTSDGKSEGKPTGAVRSTPDAYQGPRPQGGESTPAKPAN